jgi:hypothetical protein
VSFQTVSEVKTRLLRALADDFDTATAMSAIIELVGVTNKMLHQKPQHVSMFHISYRAPYTLHIRRVMPWLRQIVTGFSLWRPGLAPMLVCVGFLVDKAALRQVFL